MLIIGHRGAAGLGQENTISSFQKAEELGVDGIELDLRKTKDGHIVVIHDPDLSRTHNHHQKISELTLTELKALTSTEIPELRDALSIIKVPINLEIKETGFEKEILETIKGFPSEVFISSFKPHVLRQIKTLDRNIKLGLILSPKLKYLFYPLVLISIFFKFYSVNPHYSLLTAFRMKLLKKMGFRVFTWVINNQAEFDRVKKLGVDGVVTDYPNLIKKYD